MLGQVLSWTLRVGGAEILTLLLPDYVSQARSLAAHKWTIAQRSAL